MIYILLMLETTNIISHLITHLHLMQEILHAKKPCNLTAKISPHVKYACFGCMKNTRELVTTYLHYSREKR